MEIRVSIIVTSYNKSFLLNDALLSIKGQTFPDWECLIVDDNSNDGSWELAKKFAAEDPRFKPMKTDLDPSGHSVDLNRYTHNVNLALPKCQGDFITYLCDDDLYKPWRLEKMVEFLDKNPEAMIVYGEQETCHLDNGTIRPALGIRTGPKVCWDAAGVVDHSSVMHRRSVLEKVPGWDECLESWKTGDAYFWNRLNVFWPFYRINYITDVHRFNKWSVNHEYDG